VVIPIDESLAIARQIADAMEAAHKKEIVHRDLATAAMEVTAKPVSSPTLTISSTIAGTLRDLTGGSRVTLKELSWVAECLLGLEKLPIS
jgi:serine/threonine protein kinase